MTKKIDKKDSKTDGQSSKIIEQMFNTGAHFGYSKSKRHPSTKKFIFGNKNRVEIFDLEKTEKLLEEVKDFVKVLSEGGKQILFVSGKSEAKEAIELGASSIGMPYVAGRWIGGTLTNAGQIKKRVDLLQKLENDKEKGLLSKYTKKERLLIDRDIEKLNRKFSGLVHLEGMPSALFVIDPKKEEIAVSEAIEKKIPIIAIANSDCNIRDINYPITANDSSKASIKFFVDEIVGAYSQTKKKVKEDKKETKKVEK